MLDAARGLGTVNKAAGANAAVRPYTMKTPRCAIDNLGARLYDGVSDVIAEAVSNSHDADAEHVMVRIPAGKALATRKRGGAVVDRSLAIVAADDDHGITREEADGFCLDAIDEFPGEDKGVALGADGCRLTPICDTVNLEGPAGDSLKYRTEHGQLARKTWVELLPGAGNACEDFIRFRDESAGAGDSG